MEDEYFMNIAISESKKCYRTFDVPVGAVIVSGDKIIAKAHNKKVKTNNAICHAEVLAISKACKKIKDFRLTNCTIYITKEPCLMCMGAILSSRMKKIVFGAYDKKYGTASLAQENNFNHKCDISGGILKNECEQVLTDFFKKLRESKCK